MNLTGDDLQKCSKEETKNHYMVRNFFPQFADEIETYVSSNTDFS